MNSLPLLYHPTTVWRDSLECNNREKAENFSTYFSIYLNLTPSHCPHTELYTKPLLLMVFTTMKKKIDTNGECLALIYGGIVLS